VVPDKLGRIVLPQNLREYAQLDGEVVVAGVHSRIEVWSRQAWDAEQSRVDEDTASLAEQMAGLGI
jgi:MraZ protein